MPVFQVDVLATDTGQRLDALIAARLPQFSRTALRRAITDGLVLVDGRRQKPSYCLRGCEQIAVTAPAARATGSVPEDIPLDILYEDDDLVVINKPSGMVVHPARGHWAGTLTSALAFHFQHLSQVGGAHRPGIVHRLDRDTSGVILVAKNDATHMALSGQFERREVEKEYFAICRGRLDRDRDWIRQPIGVHPLHREKMAVRAEHATSREAETFYEVQQRWQGYVSLSVFPKTGRTHQIRVHLAHSGTPIVCDPLYSGHRRLTASEAGGNVSDVLDETIVLERLALHARRLTLRHPTSGAELTVEAAIPAELIEVARYFRD